MRRLLLTFTLFATLAFAAPTMAQTASSSTSAGTGSPCKNAVKCEDAPEVPVAILYGLVGFVLVGGVMTMNTRMARRDPGSFAAHRSST